MNEELLRIIDLFDEDEVTTADKIDRPQKALEKEMYDDFMKRNKLAGGGMLVQPSADGSRPGYSSESAKKAVLRLPDEGEIDLDKLAKKHNVSAATIAGYRDRNKPNLKSVKKTTRGPRTSGAKYEKRVKVKNYLKNLPDNSSISVLDLASELKVSRSLIDNILKEKQFKNKKFNLLRRTGSLTNEQFATEYKNFQKSDFFKTGADEEFADYLNDLGFKPQEGEGRFTPGNVGSRRRTLNIKSVATKAVPLTDKQILKEAKRLKVKNIKDLSSSELRNKVITARAKENTIKKLKEDLEFKEEQRKKQKIRMDKFIKKRKSTKEGRALLLAQRRRDKRAEYKRKGIDPLATNADEAIWRDSVLTANKNVDGKGRFSISSGYSKSMDAKDYYSNKIKIKDNQTNKTFTYNTFKNYVNKNASSFGLKNYDEAVKSYRQKFFINDKPNLRNSINFALIPNYNEAMPTSAYTIQHDFGRQINPLKTSLAFYDDNLDEYKVRTDFENAWERSKKSKTPLTDRKKAFNVFKKDLAKLNIQSVPSMVKRERFFGKGLDLTDILKTAKKEGATLPRGLLKEATEFEQKLLQDIVSYSKKSKCKINLKSEGGRIGFALSDECIRDGLNEQKIAAQKGDKKAARQLVKTAGIATRGRLLKNVLGPGAILGEAMIEGAIIGNKVLGGKPSDIAYAESYLSYLDPRKYRGELDPLKMEREDMLESTADKNILRSGFAAQDQLSAFNKAIEDRDLAKARGRIDQYIPAAAEAREQGARAGQSADIVSSEAFKDASRVAQEYLQGQAGKQKARFGIFSVPQSEQADEIRRLKAMRNMSNIMPRDFLTEKTSDLLNRTRVLRSLGYDVSTKDLMAEQDMLRSIPLSKAAEIYSPEQVYGTQGKFAGGGIAKLAGVDSGPPPERGPNSQGLQGLMKRVRNL